MYLVGRCCWSVEIQRNRILEKFRSWTHLKRRKPSRLIFAYWRSCSDASERWCTLVCYQNETVWIARLIVRGYHLKRYFLNIFPCSILLYVVRISDAYRECFLPNELWKEEERRKKKTELSFLYDKGKYVFVPVSAVYYA